MNDKKLMDCPECVIKAGALIVKARHAFKSEEDSKKVGVEWGDGIVREALFEEVCGAVDAAIAELSADDKGVVPLQMVWGDGLYKLCEAMNAYDADDNRMTYACLLQAHNAFRKVLDDHGIANPTNDQIARVITVRNLR